MLDAVKAMVKAKDEIAEIAVGQVSREPVTNLINHVLNASGMLTAISPRCDRKTCEKCGKWPTMKQNYMMEITKQLVYLI